MLQIEPSLQPPSKGSHPSRQSDAPSIQSVEESADELARLVCDLDRLLKPSPSARAANWVHNVSFSEKPEPSSHLHSESAFDWISDHDRGDGSGTAGGIVQAEQWVRKARRERRWHRARNASAWLLSIAVVCCGLALSAYLILGHLPDPADIGALLDGYSLPVF